MSDGRERILGAVRRGLGRPALSDSRRAVLDQRIHGGEQNPLRPALPARPLAELFAAGVEKVAGECLRIADRDQAPAALKTWLEAQGVAAEARMAPALAGLDWAGAGLSVTEGASAGDDLVGVSEAVLAVAETGTVILRSGPETPTTLNFLPDYHVVLVDADRLVGHFEDAWVVLRERLGNDWPRVINLITGPSRTADVEQTMQLGAHGPRRLLVLLAGA
ncbi:LutC/YkgG family protein [Alkalilimnicola ehrlichii MLHE-1]|uniref:LUD domain-containing protein n=1 Tax=Alkalilimnicola ehrlichii (strain ATCC BAA-1101 / DSM 17681 / MLHE-1) TaxID=187272 RepID=Q0A6B5_ALKEH|nr:lactate utilization protein [Alkalilimnicola ehrlichii]ABI57622.1 protein of unknown function DUF162 [Alkalilimnicola ehrlichii MLHE-1]